VVATDAFVVVPFCNLIQNNLSKMERTNRSPSPERTEPEPIRTGMITRSRRQSLPPSPVRIPFIENAIEAQRIQNIRIQQDVCHRMHKLTLIVI
jgi:hypothetical protein